MFQFLYILDKQIQYPSLDLVQKDLSRFQIKTTVDNDPTDIMKTMLNYIDNNSSEDEFDEVPQTAVEPPIFDRSTKVLKQLFIIIYTNLKLFFFIQPSGKIIHFNKPEIKPLYDTNDLDEENNEVCIIPF